MARAIRAINDGLNEGICASPRKPLKDMTTRDALIEDMARTDDAPAYLLSYDAGARGSAPRVSARTFERTAPVASESRRPQVPAAGNYTRYEPPRRLISLPSITTTRMRLRTRLALSASATTNMTPMIIAGTFTKIATSCAAANFGPLSPSSPSR